VAACSLIVFLNRKNLETLRDHLRL